MTQTKLLTCAMALSFAFATQTFAETTAELTTFAEINDSRPGNITVTPDSRVSITQPPLDGSTLRDAGNLEDGTRAPFPTQDWADSAPKLVGWNTQTDALHKIIEIPSELVNPISFLQGFALDEERSQICIADMTFTAPAADLKPALIVIDIESGAARPVLEATTLFMASDEDAVIDSNLVRLKDADGNANPWHQSMNPISIDPAFENAYLGTINGRDIWSIPAVALAAASQDDTALSTQITRNALTVSTPDSFMVFAEDDTLLRWADRFAFAPDGTLYIATNQLSMHPALNAGEDGSDHVYVTLTPQP